MLESIWMWLTDKVLVLGYPGIFGLMFLESSFFPFPSEVVMPPGGANAEAGRMSLLLVIAAGVGGSLAGALFNYWLALKVGRPALLRWGKYVLITEKKLAKVDLLFERHGEITTFVGRLIPGVRQVISFPAGLARMNLFRFCLFTVIGAGIWVVVLTMIGYWVSANFEVVKRYSRDAFLCMLPALVLIVAVYVIWYRRRNRGEAVKA